MYPERTLPRTNEAIQRPAPGFRRRGAAATGKFTSSAQIAEAARLSLLCSTPPGGTGCPPGGVFVFCHPLLAAGVRFTSSAAGEDEKGRRIMSERYESVWDALSDTREEAANMRLRSDLATAVIRKIEAAQWTQREAAMKCGITQPRLNDLMRGRISRFSLDALVNIATALGCDVRIAVGV